jgi:hypothetical protein
MQVFFNDYGTTRAIMIEGCSGEHHVGMRVARYSGETAKCEVRLS